MSQAEPNTFAVILAGGSGTRFWPASRRARPKQLLALGRAKAALIAETVRRILPLVPRERILIATGADLVEATKGALPELPDDAFLGEPVPRNTAACIGWATAVVRRRDPNAVLMVLPSDHHVADEPRFLEAVGVALDSARAGTITTLGIEPTRPDTGYGYIELGAPLEHGLMRVRRFVEKPNLEKAREYLASGRFVWNGGMFFFRASDMLAAIEHQLPELSRGIDQIEVAARAGAERELAVTNEVFQKLASISIDVGVMEKLAELNVLPASFGWSDLGSWESAWELADKDADGNAGDAAIHVDARNNLILDLRTGSRNAVTALIGVNDLCIVQTDDALLVVPRVRSQDVRLVVAELERRGQRDKI